MELGRRNEVRKKMRGGQVGLNGHTIKPCLYNL